MLLSAVGVPDAAHPAVVDGEARRARVLLLHESVEGHREVVGHREARVPSRAGTFNMRI